MTSHSYMVYSFFTQKLENNPSEYEDAFSYNTKLNKFVVADGATESIFAKRWADSLAKSFTGSELSLYSNVTAHCIVETLVVGAQKEWREWQKANWDSFDWGTRLKLQQTGACATFLGLELAKSEENSCFNWRAVAVGDCCLFEVDNDQIINAFPMSKSSDFGINPNLLSSRLLSNIKHENAINTKEGILGKNQKLLLATDSVSKFLLSEVENGNLCLSHILPKEIDGWKTIFEDAIHSGKMRKDDITVLLIES
jgi:hypothetical protein